MKKFLLFATIVSFTTSSFAQCSPDDYTFDGAQFGVSPDPLLGESFEIGYLGMAYADIIYMLVPTEAGDVDTAFAGFGTIDSLRLDAVNVSVNGNLVDISTIGLGFTCNNNGDLNDPCSFLGGEQYCADLTGTPTMAGVFPLEIAVTGWVNSFLGTIEIPYSFTNYSITVVDPDFVTENVKTELNAISNFPNPVDNSTDIVFEINKSQPVVFTVNNLLGEKVSSKNFQARRGKNTISFDASSLKAGIYLYSITAGDKKVTRRMVVN